uniref:Uncharacterized protein n=1 Tax=Cucumis melo TaxID=3656 RepID=A0A9I9DRR8_CUCME
MEAPGSLGEVERERHSAGVSFEGHRSVENALLKLTIHDSKQKNNRGRLRSGVSGVLFVVRRLQQVDSTHRSSVRPPHVDVRRRRIRWQLKP